MINEFIADNGNLEDDELAALLSEGNYDRGHNQT